MNRMKELRMQRGISMREAARLLGMPYTTYVNYEKGDREPNSETLIAIAKFYNTSIDYLLRKSDSVFPAVSGDNSESLVNNDPELTEYLDQLKNRSEMRMLFSLTKGATKDDVEAAARIIEAFLKKK